MTRRLLLRCRLSARLPVSRHKQLDLSFPGSKKYENRLLSWSGLSVQPSIHMKQHSPHWKDSRKIWSFQKSVQKIQVLLKSDNNNGTLHEDLCTFVIIFRRVLLRVRNVFDNNAEKIRTHVLYSIPFLWDDVGKQRRAGHSTHDNMAHAHCLPDN